MANLRLAAAQDLVARGPLIANAHESAHEANRASAAKSLVA